jgi:hypothetical protein
MDFIYMFKHFKKLLLSSRNLLLEMLVSRRFENILSIYIDLESKTEQAWNGISCMNNPLQSKWSLL